MELLGLHLYYFRLSFLYPFYKARLFETNISLDLANFIYSFQGLLVIN